MGSALVAMILDESKWLAAAMTIAAAALAALIYRQRQSPFARATMWAAMNIFFAVTIGTMAFGHLLAVTIKLALGTLQGPIVGLYAIGVALALPSWWLVHHATRIASAPEAAPRALMLNAWAGGTLLLLGLHNLPLAAPAILNIAYAWHSRPIVGHAMVALSVLVNGGLFVGSLVFAASGQSFEQFRGIE